jgi:hypothetical protein
MRLKALSKLGTLGSLLVFVSRPIPEAVDWPARLGSAGYKMRPDMSYECDKPPVTFLLIPGIPGRRAASFEVRVGTRRKSSREHLELTTPEMVRLAVASLTRSEASLGLEYVVQASSASPAALRDAMIRWAEAAPWSEIGEKWKTEPLKGFEGWFVTGGRTFMTGTYVAFGVAHPA